MLTQSFALGILFFFSLVLRPAFSQSVPGASFFSGGGSPGAAAYQLVDDYAPSTFFNKFNFYSSYDPTYGHVQYVNKTVAVQNGLVSITSQNTAKIIADTTNKWPRGGPGRPSVRVISDNTYTHGLFVLDVTHMPWGCGTWPAYWLLGPDWPSNGEIDIIEGVNTQQLNAVSLHSSAGCTVAGSGQTGTLQTTNCDVNANGNSGCGSLLSNTSTPNNYGSGFNRNGGGVYVTEWTSQYFKTWFFPRGSTPASITDGKPDPSSFGTPAVNHQGSCNIDQHFKNMSIIINIDFCGAWAGQVYSQFSECPQTAGASSLDSCVDYVGNNPADFIAAYWDIRSLRVYQMPPGAVASSTYATSLSSASGIATSNTIPRGMGQSSTSVQSSQYDGPLSSVTTSNSAASPTPAICPSYNNSEYIDNNQQSYTIGCGYDYNGAGNGLPGNGILQTLSFEQCLEACDTTYGCLAVAYVGGNGAGNCYLKGTQGALIFNGAVNAAIRINGAVSNASTASISRTSNAASVATGPPPNCLEAGGEQFVDSGDVSYTIACYTDFAGSNIGNALSLDSIKACLPSCDAMSGCVGVVYNTAQRLCQLKSSLTGTQSTNNDMVAARKNVVISSTSPLSGTSSTVSTSTFGYGYGYGGPDYGDYGYGLRPTSTYSYPKQSSSSSTLQASSAHTSASSTLGTSSLQISSSQSTSTKSSITSQTSSIRTTSTSVPALASSISLSTSSISSTSSSITIQPSSILSSESSSSVFSSPSFPSLATSTLSYTGSDLETSNAASASSSIVSTSSLASSSILSSSTMSTNSALSSPLSASLSTSASTGSGSSFWSSDTTSAVPLAASMIPCPTRTADYCGGGTQQSTTVCADSSGAIYSVSCGTLYYGEVIDTSNIYARAKLEERASASTVRACQALCSRYNTCVAFNYVGRNCALLSRVDGSVNSASAVAGRLVIAAAISTTSSTSSTLAPPDYSIPSSTSTIELSSSAITTLNSSSSSIESIESLTRVVTTTTLFSSVPTITITTTTTQQMPSGGSSTSVSNGSYYVLPGSSTAMSGSVTLCYDCGITPTVIVGPTSRPTPPSTCPARLTRTTTIYTTSTVTTCGSQPTCPAPGYVLVGGSTTYPGQQVVTTTESGGQPITYTQIPTYRPAEDGGGDSGAGISYGTVTAIASVTVTTSFMGPGGTNEPLCPRADNTIYTDGYGMRYRIRCDTLYSDETLDTQTQDTLSACITSCDLYNIKTFFLGTQCYGISWFSDRNSNNCLLKAGSTTATPQRGCHSCELLTPSRYNISSTITMVSASPSPYTTVVGGSIVVTTYTTTLPASTITIYSTIYTNGAYTGTPVGYSTVPASTVTSAATVTVGGTTIVTQGPGGAYYGGGGGGTGPGGGPVPGYYDGGGNGGSPSIVYAVSTAVSTYVSNGQTVYSTYGVTTVASTVYLPGTTRTVTTTSVSILVTRSIQFVPTTIVTTTTQGITTTIVTSVPVTYTQVVSTGGGSGSNGGGTVTITEGGGSGTTVYVTQTVTQTVLPPSSSRSFTCRTYATNYLNGLHGRAEPTSEPMKAREVVLEAVMPVPGRGEKQSVFQKKVIMNEIDRMAQGTRNLLTGEFDYWFID